MNRTARLAAVCALVAVLLTACSSSYPQGTAGRIVEKDKDAYKVGSSTITKRYLTTEAEDGTRTTFRVSSEHYGRCYRGSSYPGCLKRTDRD
ncbi:hypothetical protein [Streptomyces sp. NPDC000880]